MRWGTPKEMAAHYNSLKIDNARFLIWLERVNPELYTKTMKELKREKAGAPGEG